MTNSQRFTDLSPAKPLAMPESSDELKLEVLRLRDEIIGLRALLAEAEIREKARTEHHSLAADADPETHLEYLQLVAADLDHQLREIKASTTWRTGRLLLSPIRILRSLFRSSVTAAPADPS